jgi:hypothetical protein
MKPIYVESSGGLGNQMFKYCFAFHLQSLTDRPVYLVNVDAFGKSVKTHSGRANVSAIAAGGKIAFRNGPTPHHLLLILRHAFLKRLNKRSSRKVYEELSLEAAPPANSFFDVYRGYFQDPRYLQMIGFDKITTPNRLFPGITYEPTSVRSLAVHIRRGDYLNNSESIGALSDQYYSTTIRSALLLLDIDEIHIYTDEIDFQVRNLDIPKKVTARIFGPEVVDDPIKLLTKLSSYDSLILSNSSLSWWAATLSKASQVFCPDVWYKNLTYSSDLIDPTWRTFQSQWI